MADGGILRLLQTVRYLRASQVVALATRRLRRVRPDTSPAPARRDLQGVWREPVRRPSCMRGDDTLALAGAEIHLRGAGDWQRGAPRLALYELHYFDDLTAAGAPERSAEHVALIERWVVENQPGKGIGWEPYPLSRRIVNWIKWSLDGNELPAAARHSLAVQARALAGSLEWHLRANHLLANAVALLFAGAWFEGREAGGWAARGAAILTEQVDEQVLADGGHFELSPMYHAVVLEDLLDIANLAETFGVEGVQQVAERCRQAAPGMLGWLRCMCHPDGNIALFNDATLNGSAAPAQLETYAARLGIEPSSWGAVERYALEVRGGEEGGGEEGGGEEGGGGEGDGEEGGGELVHLSASGYARLRCGGALVIADVAPVGPDEQPGHAHADTLSFEMSLGERRLFVNGGTSTYEEGEQRAAERSTAAHNTAVVDGRDSSEVWGAFRVARRARIAEVAARGGAELVLAGAHDGYRVLSPPVTHRREWRMSPGRLEIADALAGGGTHELFLSLLVHPDWQVERAGDNGFRLHHAAVGGAVRVQLDDALDCELRDDAYHPGFGAARAALRLVGCCRCALPVTLTTAITWD